jgi:Rrf2 family protein
MVRISKAVEYGLVAVRHMIENPGHLVSARDLSAQFSLPGGLVAKVLQRLAAAGILESEQGVRGGYRLARDPHTVSFLELSEAVEGRQHLAACEPDGEGSCDRSDECTVAGPVHTLSARIVALLAETKIGSLLRADSTARSATVPTTETAPTEPTRSSERIPAEGA